MRTPSAALQAGLLACAISTGLRAAPPEPIQVDQGSHWGEHNRQEYYTYDQGARIMPASWIIALKQADGTPFTADNLSRYGYLPNPNGPVENLPVGFTLTNDHTGQNIGMNCSACHTRQIEVGGQAYRIDGGPAIVDFQHLLSDLDAAMGRVVNQDEVFDAFALNVLGSGATQMQRLQLQQEVKDWYLPYHTLMQRALPDPPWGPARLDAVSMIFNRLAGLDIGPPPHFMIPDNIQPADAPVRYPFLWNASKQDYTQWPGFSQNGNEVFSLARNLGEVYGVFAIFHPKKDKSLLKINYLGDNSANFHGLEKFEELIRRIGPPKWPWKVDLGLAEQGKAIYNRSTADGGCVECHGIRKGEFRGIGDETWATKLVDVGTDSREYSILKREVNTGVLSGAKVLIKPALKPQDTAFNTLATAVLGSILQHTFKPSSQGQKAFAQLNVAHTAQLKDAYRTEAVAAEPQFPYESRVLEGIWAAAPYLHNGSVPTLAELLKPASERVASFAVGPAYDIDAIGLAAKQDRFGYSLQTTDCSQRDSGNSRCGHEFGTQLPAAEKTALLEYLKLL
ncbi:di-heme-cytochrome C peroxidase [Pseudomonas sp. RIT-PI-AD]|uniref:di-heme-cytochrome C peroxidase n=1 Tax=Pseudomonas sp. RIT-PI-AD TaxID=3035294 RepID=UPI0021DB2BAA|nr:di-heme-cytochrome C peroxidase [Pseudomonas sp. RIT-PI-AD]